MIKETVIQVKGVNEVSTGTKKDGSKWTMYLVKDTTDTEYKTFEIMTIGTPYQISYEEEPKKPFVAKKGPEAGKMITPKGVDRFIKRAVITDAPPMGSAPQSGTGQQVITLEGLKRQMDTINERLDVVEGRIKTLEDANRPDF